MRTNTTSIRYLSAISAAAALTAIIAVSASNLTHFEIVGKTVAFAYPWRLMTPTAAARLTAWTGYLLHTVLTWLIIYRAKQARPGYRGEMRWFNWSMASVHVVFALLHVVQTHLFYDGLAQDVPEVTAQGSVALMLILLLMLETPRRGLILGTKVPFSQHFMQMLRKYHGYLFTWATIYTFWYHPTEGTAGHLLGFFYMFMLFAQSSLIFNRAHLNKWWTFTLEVFVLVHSVVVAVFQGNDLWPMFAFGFGAMIVLTQMHGLGLSRWSRAALGAGFVVLILMAYGSMGRLAALNEVVRIPVLEYVVVAFIYGLYAGVNKLSQLARRRAESQAAG